MFPCSPHYTIVFFLLIQVKSYFYYFVEHIMLNTIKLGIFMSTPFKGGQHVLLRLASALALASGLTLRHPLLDFFWVHQNMIPVLWRSFSTGDIDLQGQGQACRGDHLKNHLN